MGSGPLFEQLQGIVLDQDGHILVSDLALNAIFRVDPDSGDRLVLSDGVTGGGPSFVGLRGGVAVAPGTLGDLDGDDKVDFDDIPAFVLGLVNSADYEQQYGVAPSYKGDCHRDGRLDFDDIPCFVEILTGSPMNGSLRSVPEPSCLVLCAAGLMALFACRVVKS